MTRTRAVTASSAVSDGAARSSTTWAAGTNGGNTWSACHAGTPPNCMSVRALLKALIPDGREWHRYKGTKLGTLADTGPRQRFTYRKSMVSAECEEVNSLLIIHWNLPARPLCPPGPRTRAVEDRVHHHRQGA